MSSRVADAAVTFVNSPAHRWSTTFSGRPYSSVTDRGSSSSLAMCPGKDSCVRAERKRSAEPVSRNLPFSCGPSRSEHSLMAGIRSGTYWNSSSTARLSPSERTNPCGSLCTDARVAWSSSVTYSRPRSREIERASVVFPACRGPVRQTMRNSTSSSHNRGCRRLAYMAGVQSMCVLRGGTGASDVAAQPEASCPPWRKMQGLGARNPHR